MRAVAILLMVALASSVEAQSVEETPPADFGDQRAVRAQEQVLRAELARPGISEWAGEYRAACIFDSDSLLVVPGSGFLFQHRHCGMLGPWNTGSADVVDGRLHLAFKYQNDPDVLGLDPEFLLVRWGERRYLVPPGDLMRFCSDINSGDEPRREGCGFHLLRRGDERRPAAGPPELPPEGLAALLQVPVSARVLSLGESSPILEGMARSTPITIDAGRLLGLRAGMRLHLDPATGSSGWMILEEVGDEEAFGVLTEPVRTPDPPSPAVGWCLSTRDPRHPSPMEPAAPAR